DREADDGQIHVDDVAECVLRVVGDADPRPPVGGRDPLVLGAVAQLVGKLHRALLTPKSSGVGERVRSVSGQRRTCRIRCTYSWAARRVAGSPPASPHRGGSASSGSGGTRAHRSESFPSPPSMSSPARPPTRSTISRITVPLRSHGVTIVSCATCTGGIDWSTPHSGGAAAAGRSRGFTRGTAGAGPGRESGPMPPPPGAPADRACRSSARAPA